MPRRDDEPLDPDDDEDRDGKHRRRRGPDPEEVRRAGVVALWGLAKWGFVALGGLLAVVALNETAIKASALAGLACFLGVCSRLCQAEELARRG